MREIKFRGKTANGEWAYGSLVYSENIQPAIYFEVGKGSVKTFDFVYVRPETVGQFTGLPDKNGDELYECDIIEHNNTLYVIEYSENNVGFICIDRKHKTRSGFPNWRDGSWLYNVHKYVKRIGNIYDKPELREVGE